MTMMTKQLRVSVCRICRLGLIKDGKMGTSQARADRIKTALNYTGGSKWN